MKKADYLGSRALKGAMAFVLAVGLCPVAPAMAQEGATTSGEGGAESPSVEAPADDAANSIDEAGTSENEAAQLESGEIVANDAATQSSEQLSVEDASIDGPDSLSNEDGANGDELEALDDGSIVDNGSCGQGVTYKIYDSGLMKIEGSGGVSFSGDAPYTKTAQNVKVLVVGENITSFCNRSFTPLKQCRAIFFFGSMTPGHQKYFSQYAFSGFDQDRKCSYYHDPSNDTWKNFEIGKTCKPWIDGMLDIDWASMVEFKECGENSFWVLSNDGTLSVRGVGAVTGSAYSVEQRESVSRLVVEDGVTSIGKDFHLSSDSYSDGGFTNLVSASFADSVCDLSEGMFHGCSSLQEVKLPAHIGAIPTSFFEGCASLEQVEIPYGVTEISESAFYGCSGLRTVDFGNSLKTIGESAFEKCSALSSICLPETVSEIGEKAFAGTAIAKVVIPGSVESLNMTAFNNCSSLEEVEFEGAQPKRIGDAYSGNKLKGVHRSDDQSWQTRDKYRTGDIVWYTRGADGSLMEDDYISPWPSKNLEIDGGYSGDMHSGSRDHYAYYFTVSEADSFDINWGVSPWYDECTHWSFSFTLKSTAGNEGKKLDFWYADPKTADIGSRKMPLAPGSYVIETYGLDSHHDSAGYAGVSVKHQKRAINDASIALGTESYEYTGTAIAPRPEVYWGGNGAR